MLRAFEQKWLMLKLNVSFSISVCLDIVFQKFYLHSKLLFAHPQVSSKHETHDNTTDWENLYQNHSLPFKDKTI